MSDEGDNAAPAPPSLPPNPPGTNPYPPGTEVPADADVAPRLAKRPHEAAEADAPHDPE